MNHATRELKLDLSTRFNILIQFIPNLTILMIAITPNFVYGLRGEIQIVKSKTRSQLNQVILKSKTANFWHQLI